MHFNCRNLNGTVLLFAIINHLMLAVQWEQTNSSNKFAANLNMKGISFLYSPCIRPLVAVYMSQVCRAIPFKRSL